MFRPARLLLAAVAAVAYLLPAVTVALEDDDVAHEARQRISQLIDGLDAPVVLRESLVEKLTAEAKGENAAVAMELLLSALDFTNMQIREGVVDVLARVGDRQSVQPLIRRLRYDVSSGVRLRIMQVLPLFLIQDDKTRLEALARTEQDEYAMTVRLREIMRKDPVKPGSGEYDSSLYHVRRAIEAALAEQLDPVETAVNGLDTKKDDALAQGAILLFCGKSLGRTREDSLERWKSLAREGFDSPAADTIVTIQSMAWQILSDIGTTGSEFLAEKTRFILATGNDTSREQALNSLAEICGVARDNAARHAARLTAGGRSMPEAEAKWRQEEIDGAALLAKLALEVGLEVAEDQNLAVRAAAYRCVGASRSEDAVARLRKKLIEGGEPLDMQAEIALALGQIGGDEAARTLGSLAKYQGFGDTPKAQREEYRLLLSAVDGLGDIAGRFDRDSGLLSPRDPHASRIAYARIVELLSDPRKLPAAPSAPNGEESGVAELALRQLQAVIGVNDATRAPEVWTKYYDDLMLKLKVSGAPEPK